MTTLTTTHSEENEKTAKKHKKWSSKSSGSSSCLYFMGMIGAAVYYISVSTSFWGGLLGFLKALVWPAFMVYDVLTYFGS